MALTAARAVEQVISLSGNINLGGVYILRIDVLESLAIRFGNFLSRKPIQFEPGEYLYLGSAQGKGTSLAQRVIRHLNRTENKPNQSILHEVTNQLSSFTGNALPAARQKKLHWHIDYLLDNEHVIVKSVIMIGHPHPLEEKVATLLMHDTHTTIIEPGLGAQDYRDHTHLLRVNAPISWWTNLTNRVVSDVTESTH
ncbi:MAG: GIY-YIG nuclease family protein [Candidatus Kariarchaeaceae archaeon]|jgi:Uri superfamily endonuclease